MSLWRIALLLILGLLLAACGSSAATVKPLAERPPRLGDFTLTLATGDLAVGRQRFSFGILDHGRPIRVPTAQIGFYLLRGATGKLQQVRTARFRSLTAGLSRDSANQAAYAIQGILVAYPTFHHPGQYLVAANFHYHGQDHYLRQDFFVQRHSLSPAVGALAPRTRTPTIATTPIRLLDSGHPPDDMHRLSIAAALAQHRPLVVIFSSPGFCISRMCGPETQIVEGLERRYRGRANFIHIEVYKNANPRDGFAPAMKAWHLTTDPWVFVINRAGRITAKFFGPAAGSEIAAALRRTF